MNWTVSYSISLYWLQTCTECNSIYNTIKYIRIETTLSHIIKLIIRHVYFLQIVFMEFLYQESKHKVTDYQTDSSLLVLANVDINEIRCWRMFGIGPFWSILVHFGPLTNSTRTSIAKFVITTILIAKYLIYDNSSLVCLFDVKPLKNIWRRSKRVGLLMDHM